MLLRDLPPNSIVRLFHHEDVEFDFTGSRIIGGHNGAGYISDLDIIVNINDYKLIKGHLTQELELHVKECEFQNNSKSLKFEFSISTAIPNLLTINYIFLDSTNYSAWMKATDICKALVPVIPKIASDKRTRIAIFSELVKHFGGTENISNSTSSSGECISGKVDLYHALTGRH